MSVELSRGPNISTTKYLHLDTLNRVALDIIPQTQLFSHGQQHRKKDSVILVNLNELGKVPVV
jgi:hypothetical protein